MIRIYIRKLKSGEDAHSVGRALLRELLGEKPLIFGAHGKPYLQDKSAYFNISHCKGFVAIAVGKREIGLDIEPLNRTVKAKTFAGEGEEQVAPLSLWVLKESFAKWSGEGISILRSTRVTPIEENTYQGRFGEKEAFLKLFEYEGICGAVCCEIKEEYEIKEM